jgi:hypothetical protein
MEDRRISRFAPILTLSSCFSRSSLKIVVGPISSSWRVCATLTSESALSGGRGRPGFGVDFFDRIVVSVSTGDAMLEEQQRYAGSVEPCRLVIEWLL